MKITGLRKNSSNDRISVEVDGNFAVSVSLEALMEEGVNRGAELTKEQLKRLQNRSSVEHASAEAVRLLKYGRRTEADLLDRLQEKGYDRLTSDTVVQKLKQLGLIDDREYCHSFFLSHRDMNGWGPDKIRHALRKKGLPEQLIEEAAGEGYDRDTAVEQAVRAGYKKLRSLQRKTDNKQELRIRLNRFLYSRGFDAACCQTAVSEILLNQED